MSSIFPDNISTNIYIYIYDIERECSNRKHFKFPPKTSRLASTLGNTDLINSDTRAEATPSVLHTHGRRSVALTADAA